MASTLVFVRPFGQEKVSIPYRTMIIGGIGSECHGEKGPHGPHPAAVFIFAPLSVDHRLHLRFKSYKFPPVWEEVGGVSA